MKKLTKKKFHSMTSTEILAYHLTSKWDPNCIKTLDLYRSCKFDNGKVAYNYPLYEAFYSTYCSKLAKALE